MPVQNSQVIPHIGEISNPLDRALARLDEACEAETGLDARCAIALAGWEFSRIGGMIRTVGSSVLVLLASGAEFLFASPSDAREFLADLA